MFMLPLQIQLKHRLLSALVENYSLVQHVVGATNKSGHTLDLVLSRATENCVTGLKVLDALISDYCPVTFNLITSRPPAPRKTVVSRKYKAIDINALKTVIDNSDLAHPISNDRDELVTLLCDFNWITGQACSTQNPHGHSQAFCSMVQ